MPDKISQMEFLRTFREQNPGFEDVSDNELMAGLLKRKPYLANHVETNQELSQNIVNQNEAAGNSANYWRLHPNQAGFARAVTGSLPFGGAVIGGALGMPAPYLGAPAIAGGLGYGGGRALEDIANNILGLNDTSLGQQFRNTAMATGVGTGMGLASELLTSPINALKAVVRGGATVQDIMPPVHRWFTPSIPERTLEWAAKPSYAEPGLRLIKPTFEPNYYPPRVQTLNEFDVAPRISSPTAERDYGTPLPPREINKTMGVQEYPPPRTTAGGRLYEGPKAGDIDLSTGPKFTVAEGTEPERTYGVARRTFNRPPDETSYRPPTGEASGIKRPSAETGTGGGTLYQGEGAGKISTQVPEYKGRVKVVEVTRGPMKGTQVEMPYNAPFLEYKQSPNGLIPKLPSEYTWGKRP